MLQKMLSDMNASSPTRLNNRLLKQHDFGSPMTIDSSKNFKVGECKFKPAKHHYLLIKNFSERFSTEMLEERYSAYEGFERVVMIPGSKNAYIKFGELEQIQYIIAENESNTHASHRLKMCIVNKLPLDLNEKSRILLLTVYNEKIEINVHSVYEIFKDFGKISKMIIFKKKNYQIFIEFETADDASFFKEAFHNINYKGIFFLKIQFTQKSSLIVNSNNLYEHDFNKETKRRFIPHSIDVILNSSHERPRAITTQNLNIIPSLNQLEDGYTTHTISPPRISPQNEKHNHVLRVTNLSPEVKHKTIFNLFSLYGNIDKITMDPLGIAAEVYFASEFDQITAYHYLNCIELFGKVVSLELLKQKDGNTGEYFTEIDDSNTVYYAKNKVLRPEDIQNKQRTINKPSSILYVFNLSRSATLEMIRSMFESTERVQNIYYVNESRNSALCFFNNVEAAMRILCLFKNMNIIDKSLKINFANETLVRNTSDQKYKGNYYSCQEFDENSKFSKLFRGNECTSIKAEKVAGKERSRFAFNEFKLF